MRPTLPAIAALLLLACGSTSPVVGGDAADVETTPPADSVGAADATSSPDVGPDEPLSADAGANAYVLVGEPITLDGSASTGALTYQWSFGDGEAQPTPGDTPVVSHTYASPGRYSAVLTVRDATGDKRTDAVLVSATRPATFAPRPSSTIAAIPGTERVAVVSPDSHELTVIERGAGDTFSVIARYPAAGAPRTVTPLSDGRLLVPCQETAVLRLIDPADGAEAEVALPYGSRPYGATWNEHGVFVSLQATGQLAVIAPGDATTAPSLIEVVEAIEDARAVAALPDGRVAVSRWRSPTDRGEVAVYDPSSGDVSLWELPFDDHLASDTETGGVPSYLNAVLVAPTADIATITGLQANIGQGAFVDGVDLAHDTVLRAMTATIDLDTDAELTTLRSQYDNRALAFGGTYSSRGDWFFVTMRGSRAVERVDVLTGSHAGTILFAGFAPEGVALSPDDRHLYVDATLSREVRVYDVTDWTSLPQPIAALPIPTEEPLDAQLLLGKQLFNDSFDTRLAKDGYMACAHCHLDGEEDHRVWDFTDRGEGLRNTIGLIGHAGDGDGPIHWSANFDEVHDFEHDIRGPFGGAGLMTDEDFHTGTTDQTLGDPKAGVSPDLDALAAYVTSLDTHPPSPHRGPDGGLTPAATAGQVLFDSPETGCTECHPGPRLTDSQWLDPTTPLLHDVGTLGPGSGQRLGGELPGIDTPTLHGLWRSAPYLHDGSAATLHEVLTTRNEGDAHGVTSHLTPTEVDELVHYMLALDGRVD